jgi:hypothetical protein
MVLAVTVAAPPVVNPLPLTVIVCPTTAVAGEAVITMGVTSKLNVADSVPSVIVTTWVPVGIVFGTTNLWGVSGTVVPVDGRVRAVLVAAVVPTVELVLVLITADPVKSVRSTLTVPPGVALALRGVAPAFWAKVVALAFPTPAASTTQTYCAPEPWFFVVAETMKVPENRPEASMAPLPSKTVDELAEPVVGAVTFCGLSLMLQTVQLAVKPPPVTVTVPPLAAVLGVKLTKLVIA